MRHALEQVFVLALISVLAGCFADKPIGPDFEAALPSAAAVALAFRQITAGSSFTCGVTTDDQAYCWGGNQGGQLGDGTTTDRLKPVAVLGGIRFRMISAGANHVCGVTIASRAYCWGAAGNGELGNGTALGIRTSPVAVLTGLRFRTLDAGTHHTCGLGEADRKAYCWGYNVNGALGDGTRTTRLTPVAVAGARVFAQISAGGEFTCATTPTFQAYCWGNNELGKLGIGTENLSRPLPLLVAGGHAFRQVHASTFHTCAVTTGNRAFCWGYGREGQIGDGTTNIRFTPRLVTATLSFTRVTAGLPFSCGEAADNRAYCWGNNSVGQLGDGTTTRRLSPVAVIGGLTFTQLTSGTDGNHTCGKTGTGAVYCWGNNPAGALGDGTRINRFRPVRVITP